MTKTQAVRYADDSALALSMIAEYHPALILLDTNLPGEGIATVLHMIRTNGSQSRCLVLAGDLGEQREAIDAGADVALLKGCTTEELFDAMRELLAEQEGSSS